MISIELHHSSKSKNKKLLKNDTEERGTTISGNAGQQRKKTNLGTIIGTTTHIVWIDHITLGKEGIEKLSSKLLANHTDSHKFIYS